MWPNRHCIELLRPIQGWLSLKAAAKAAFAPAPPQAAGRPAGFPCCGHGSDLINGSAGCRAVFSALERGCPHPQQLRPVGGAGMFRTCLRPGEPRRPNRNPACPLRVSKAPNAPANATNAYSFATSAYSNAPTKHAEVANEDAEAPTKHAEMANEDADAVSQMWKTLKKPPFAPVKPELGRFRDGGGGTERGSVTRSGLARGSAE